jgi:hypothetical protein
LVLATPTRATSDCACAAKDPHLTLAHGGHADLRGTNKALYSFLSAPNLALNVRTRDSLFRLGQLNVDGSFITEAHIVARTLTGKLLRLTYDAERLTQVGTSHDMVNATCGDGGAALLETQSALECEEIRVSIDWSTLVVEAVHWRLTVAGQPVHDRLAGPHHRLDLSVAALVDEASLGAHGIIGQSFDGSEVPRFGRLDQYPPLDVPADFATSAMAEGAIEGVAADYEVAAPYSTSFKFSRFDDAAAEAPARIAPSIGAAAGTLSTAVRQLSTCWCASSPPPPPPSNFAA